MDKIIMSGLEFYGFHGCLPHEKVQGQKFIVHLELWKELERAGQTDNLEFTVDYSNVYLTAKNVVEGRTYHLIEAVAENIAYEVLSRFAVSHVKVRIDKPQAPVDGKFDSFAVEIERSR
ncbi:dihydroneopterin aldolase [Metallumcola ferriviriculae]|uniref:7,8-dihydroneopterin aldolase n=1 Tax=Metallumcola ferriviriculae TaxID=3039180 RepID=A0AAU0UKM9_9FIRM|nr:dihydroneopterin aldolase [Desulfitibacteraceae bacterium MK1]